MIFEEDQNQTNLSGSQNNSCTVADLSSEDVKVLKKIKAIKDSVLNSCETKIQKGSEKTRLQHGSHNGSNVFFNKDGSDTRFGLIKEEHGTLYLANTSLTAMKEVFQNKQGIKESDLENYYIGTVVIEKDCSVLDLSALIKASGLTLNDVTTSSRHVTQSLAKRAHAAGMDGIAFISNVTTEECLALWHNDPSGKGIASTKSQTKLSEFEENGLSAADILVDHLGIPVEE